VPFTTAFDDESYPFEVLVETDEGPLREDSVAQCSRIRTVAIGQRITTNLGAIPADRTDQVDRALHYSLGLSPPE
jgi:mRNA interferase MazF